MSDSRTTIASVAIEYAAVTERVELEGGPRTNTVVMCTAPRVVRFMDTIYALEPEAGLQGFRI